MFLLYYVWFFFSVFCQTLIMFYDNKDIIKIHFAPFMLTFPLIKPTRKVVARA